MDILILGIQCTKEVGILEIFDAMGRMVYEDKVAQWGQYKSGCNGDAYGNLFCRIKWEAKVRQKI
ncbi:MAG: hypothetical protein IPP34_14075 [Bacteroidetes bacterium]|nr:hypothetical protein [Bacteroidota bacterium]